MNPESARTGDETIQTGRWTRLCALLDDDPQLAPGVRSALADPEAYLERPGTGGMPGPGVPVAEPWQTLLDGLDDAGALAYLDAADSGMELAEALAALPRVVVAGPSLATITDLEGDLPAVIGAADELLAAHGLGIVQLVEEADACPLVVVPAERVPEILQVVRQLGRAARAYS